MGGNFSSRKMWIMLQILTSLIAVVKTSNAKIKGTFKCTPPRHREITCSTTSLPTVTSGSFDCAPNTDVSMGGVCTLLCSDGFYPAYSNRTKCETGTNQEGKWSNGHFVCLAITCSTNNLPNVEEGSFNCAPNTDISKSEACTLTCNEGFYPADSRQAVCKAGTIQGGVWSDENFVCREKCFLTCGTRVTIVSQWPSNFEGNVTFQLHSVIRNGWTATLYFPQNIVTTVEIWNAERTDSYRDGSGTVIKIKNKPWNTNIRGKFEFKFIVTIVEAVGYQFYAHMDGQPRCACSIED